MEPITNSVEPPPMSVTSVIVRSAGSCSLVAPRKVSRASWPPSRIFASSP